MGARDESIELIFAIEGTLIGLGGVGVGVLSGMAVSTQLAWIQTRIEQITGVDTLPSSVYQISTLPSEVDPLQVFGVVTIALVLALGATLLPSRHGSRLDPVERLRDD
jgi:lipoprotein-releasing system permease protein